MTPAKRCKEVGIESLSELSEMCEIDYRSLLTWFKTRPALFEIILKGACFQKNIDNFKSINLKT